VAEHRGAAPAGAGREPRRTMAASVQGMIPKVSPRGPRSSPCPTARGRRPLPRTADPLPRRRGGPPHPSPSGREPGSRPGAPARHPAPPGGAACRLHGQRELQLAAAGEGAEGGAPGERLGGDRGAQPPERGRGTFARGSGGDQTVAGGGAAPWCGGIGEPQGAAQPVSYWRER